jgi:hypothetical protein
MPDAADAHAAAVAAAKAGPILLAPRRRKKVNYVEEVRCRPLLPTSQARIFCLVRGMTFHSGRLCGEGAPLSAPGFFLSLLFLVFLLVAEPPRLASCVGVRGPLALSFVWLLVELRGWPDWDSLCAKRLPSCVAALERTKWQGYLFL